jgi:hypothetical protein
MPSAGLDLAIPATKRPQTYALDRAATGIGSGTHSDPKFGRRRGGGCYLYRCQEKEVPERRSCLRPSEKELLERRFVIKVPLYICIYTYIETPTNIYILYMISALGLRGLFSSRTPMDNHAHTTFEITALHGTVSDGSWTTLLIAHTRT